MAVVIPALSAFMIGVLNIKRQNKIMMDKLEGLNVQVVSMSFDVKDIRFERELLNLVNREVNHITGYSKSIEQVYKDSMIFLSKLLEEVVLNYYYSDARGDKFDITRQLTSDFNSLKREFFQYLASLFTIKRTDVYNSNNKAGITFAEYVKKSNFGDKLELFMIRLEENGYTPETFKSDVKAYVNKIFDRYTEIVSDWKELAIIDNSPKTQMDD